MATRTVPTIERTNELIEDFFNSRVQRGSISIVSATSATVTFLNAFTLVPVVVLTMRDPANKVATITTVSTTGFTVDMGNVTTVNIDWLAVAR